MRVWWLVPVIALAALPSASAHLHFHPTGFRHEHHVSAGHGPLEIAVEAGTGHGHSGTSVSTDARVTPGPSEDAITVIPPDIEDADLQLPNLVPMPAYDLEIGEADGPLTGVDATLDELGRPEGYVEGPVLRFTTTIVNRGDFSLELVGVPGAPDPETDEVLTTEAYQCVRWGGPEFRGAQRVCTGYAKMGTLTYHAYHRHFHIDGFAKYQLRRDDGGRPMHGPGSVVAESSKVGWCVSDMEQPRDEQGQPVPGEPYYQECSGMEYSPVSTRQGISPGWGDTYWYQFAGQQIPLNGVKNGIYWLSIWMNPPHNPFGLEIRETRVDDNISYQRIRLLESGTRIEVL